MTDRLSEILIDKGASWVLHIFGLDKILTDQDDPWLWAAVLVHHWPAPWDPEMNPATLRFGIGGIVDKSVQDELSSRSGMEPIEEWCFDSMNTNRLTVKLCSTTPTLSFMTLLASVNLNSQSDLYTSMVRNYLEISRPSNKIGKALVHKGFTSPPNVGAGQTRYWIPKEDGSWIETDDIYSQWLT
jgi:hypothetical protein